MAPTWNLYTGLRLLPYTHAGSIASIFTIVAESSPFLEKITLKLKLNTKFFLFILEMRVS